MGTSQNKLVIQERRNKIWTLITKGMEGYKIAKELNVAPATVSRDIKHLTEQSRDYLNSLARQTLPFMFQTSIDGIREVLKECWIIYQSDDESINWFQKLAALKLIKECNEAQFKLLSDAPSLMMVKTLEEKLTQLENRQRH
jgi:predicted transcriptional regulator